MKEYTIFHPLLYSFFSRSLYRDVGVNWNGLGFLYLLLLLSLAWIPAAVRLHRTVGAFVENVGPMVLEQVPTLTITDGEVSLSEPQPYFIRIPGSEAPLAVIDTTGQTTPASHPDALLLLTRNQLVLRQSGDVTRIYDLAGVKSFRLDRTWLERCGAWVRSWLALAIYPFLVLGSFVYRILQVLLYGAIGMLFLKAVKADLEYADLVRLSAVAVTPPVLLDTFRGWMGWPSGYLWWFACLAMALGYLFLAVRACAPSPGGEAPAPGGLPR